ncbi:MAG: hypothetical protein ACRD2A_25365, partial [Vicinamibacterales bacterium]
VYTYRAVGKLVPGVDLARAQAQMRTIGDNLARLHPENRLTSVSVISLHERVTGNLQTTLWVLMSAVVVVWLIACANIASLLIARAATSPRVSDTKIARRLGSASARKILFSATPARCMDYT